MKVLFFAQARVAAGRAAWEVPASGPMTQQEFWAALVSTFPDLAAQHKSARLARQQAYLDRDALLEPEDEIAVLPPVSGG